MTFSGGGFALYSSFWPDMNSSRAKDTRIIKKKNYFLVVFGQALASKV